jgi:hypothetical protein
MMSLVTRTSVPSGSGLSTAEIESVRIYQLGLYIADTLSDATVGRRKRLPQKIRLEIIAPRYLDLGMGIFNRRDYTIKGTKQWL